MNSPVDISPNHLDMVLDILNKHLPADVKVWVFGSRVNWTTKDSSDLDLALEGNSALDHSTIVQLETAFEESVLPYKVDIIDLNQVSDSFRRIVKVQRVSLIEEHSSDNVSVDQNWVPVSDVATIVIGGTPSRSVGKYWRGKIPWATAKDVATASGRYLDLPQEFITVHGLESSAAKLMPKGTIVITARGTVGALVQLGQDMAFNQTCYALIPRNGVYQDFLFYALKGTLHHMRAFAYGTIFDTITRKTFNNWRIPLPHLSKQQTIAHILGTLDDKIALNRRMNQTLEDVARALFKSWFVDFGPIRAKMDGRWRRGESLPGLPTEYYNIFPDRLVNSDLGEIPEGWQMKRLEEFANLNSESWSQANHPDSVEYVDLANTKLGMIELTQHFSWESAPSRAKRVLRPGDTIIGTVRPGNGSYSFIGIDGLTASTSFVVLRPIHAWFRELVYLSVTDRDNIERLAHRAGGVVYPAAHSRIVGETKVAVPIINKSVLCCFSNIVGPILDKIELTKEASRTLVSQRVVLLPKLISGEFRMEQKTRRVNK